VQTPSHKILILLFLILSSCTSDDKATLDGLNSFVFDDNTLCKIERVAFVRRDAGLPAVLDWREGDDHKRFIVQLISEDAKLKLFDKYHLSANDYHFGTLTIIVFPILDLVDQGNRWQSSPNIMKNLQFIRGRTNELSLIFEDGFEKQQKDWYHRRKKIDKFIRKKCGI
jgi:hypothetical protein